MAEKQTPAPAGSDSSHPPARPPSAPGHRPPGFPFCARVESLAEKYALALPNAVQSPRSGELGGKRTGSSVEYHDRKDFAPGDDLRHVDWRGYARSDRMTVKLYREEIMPRIDIVIDGSASMEVTPGKRQRTLEMAYLFWLLARRIHSNPRCWLAGHRPLQLLAHPFDLLNQAAIPVENPISSLRDSQLSRSGGIRIFISDLLFPFDPAELEATLGRADRLLVVQVLSAFEDDPGRGLASGSMVRLINAEAGEHIDVRLDESTVAHYRKRLSAFQADLSRRLALRGGALAITRDDASLDDACQTLHRAGMLYL